MGKTKQKGNAVMRKITELKEKQEIALGILLYLDEVCRKHHLIYFAADGTLLGLIRHQGFIPWDDDVDVWMPRADYEKLEQIVNSETDTPYRVMNFHNTKLPAEAQEAVLSEAPDHILPGWWLPHGPGSHHL